MSRSECLIGLDLGTTSIKAVALGVDGATVAVQQTPTPVTSGTGGRSEHPADALRADVLRVLRQLTDRIGRGCLPVAVGVTSMGEAGAPLDADGRVLYPVIAWSDRRTRPQIDRLRRAYTDDELYSIVGHTLEPCWGFPKLMWLKESEPGLFGRTTTWLSVADLAVFWLSGAKATDYSLASRTMAFDQERLTWATPLLSDVGLSADLMPEARQGGTVVGHVLPDVARRTGLPAGISVVLGGHDRLSGAFAARAGTSSIVDSVGTAEAVVVVTSREQPASRAAREQHTPRYCDVTPGRMAYSARVGLAGGLVEWARRELFSPVGGPLADYDDMLAELPADGGFTGVVCYPSFGRAIKPSTQDDLVQGAFMGVTASHGRGELLQSCLEASAFSLRSNLDALALDTHTVRVEGGAVRNARWMQIRADVTGRRLESVEADHVAAVGAALLAGVGADVYPSHDAAAAAVRPRTRTWLPDPHRSSRYDEVYRTVYQRLPDAIAPVNRALNALTHEQIERNAHGS